MKEAVILAGGFGTRLRSVVQDVPKPMAPVSGRPFLEYLLRSLVHQGFSKAIISVGYQAEKIIRHFGNSFRTLELQYALEDEPLGTGGAIKLALSHASSDDVLVLNGDTFFDVDLDAMYLFHREKAGEATLAVRLIDDASRYGSVVFNSNNLITGFTEKNTSGAPGWINGGIYFIRKNLLDDVTERKFSFENDCLQKQYNVKRLYAFTSPGYFIDIGIPSDYQRAQNEFQAFKY